MTAAVHADISPLLEALSASDVAGVVEDTLDLLGPQQVPPAKIAARVAIPAAWAGGDGHALLVLGAAGRLAEWMRSIPSGPEPEADEYRQLAPALPLTQGLMAVANRVATGMREPHPELPSPLTPFEVETQLTTSSLAAMRDAFAKGDTQAFGRLLMGFYRVGADYRTLLTHLYATLAFRYPTGGHPLAFAVGSARVLDMADWGDRVPPFIHWLLEQVITPQPDEPFVETVRRFAADPEHDLAWVQKRLAPAREEGAGQQFRRNVAEGDATAACEAVLKALRDGASPRGVASALATTAAEQLLLVPEGDADALLRAGHVLLYAHSVHVALTHTQDPVVYPLLYTAAGAVNAMPRPEAEAPAVAAPSSMPMVGGMMGPALLRSLEQQIGMGDTRVALATARRYVQLGNPPRGLAGMIGSAASRRTSEHMLPLVAAAAEEYLTQPGATWLSFTSQAASQSPLLTAAIRMAAELPGDTQLGRRVEDAIAIRVRVV